MAGPRALTAASTVLCALALTLFAPTAALAAAGEPQVSAPAPEDAFEEGECTADVPADDQQRVTCGMLTVPERRSPEADPEKTLQLPVTIIAGRAPTTSDPLVFPTSGASSMGRLDALRYFLDDADWAGEDRDVILIEQRGDAHAKPTLDCPELDIEHFVVDGTLLSGDAALERRAEQLTKCHERLIAEGIDLTAYTSAETAADLADLRAALEYDEWNLYGASYGSRLALTAMRDRPEGLRAVILDGVYAPQINRYEDTPAGFTASVDTLLADCAAHAECSRRYPDLEQSLRKVLAGAAEQPLSVTVKNPANGSPLRVRLSDTDLVDGLVSAFSDASVLPVVPYVIDRLAAGEVEAAIPLAQRIVDDADGAGEGLQLSIDCAEEAPFNDDARIAAAIAADELLAHYSLSDGFRADCELWAVPALPPTENLPVSSAIPTLLMSGQYDPVTPAAFAESTAETLALPHVYTFPGRAHGVVWTDGVDDCAAWIAEQFLQDPVTPPDASCIDAMSSPDFLTSEAIHPMSSISRLDGDLIRDRDPLQMMIAGSTVLIFAATLVYAAIYALRWLGRRRGDAPGGLVLVAATSAGLNLASAGGLALVLLNADPMIVAFGLPSGAWPLLVVPFVALAATILLIVSLVRAWMQEEGSLFHRVVLSVSAAASAGFALWLLARGLLML
ncbi:alpha/beta hydrolase fold [Microbacterium sp. cf046]|uniref:alpha/beta fold hydrolase n=1 Tax=Microbacterium sp. cf046 TaxID=1761803 RepID=UPI0008EAE853|nr:alpha/beta fold hydrolase [Microbacterium sp. cf046]SFR94895.1 alpha/beta hydrolase fold [Microbacterium sp. cf046]